MESAFSCHSRRRGHLKNMISLFVMASHLKFSIDRLIYTMPMCMIDTKCEGYRIGRRVAY